MLRQNERMSLNRTCTYAATRLAHFPNPVTFCHTTRRRHFASEKNFRGSTRAGTARTCLGGATSFALCWLRARVLERLCQARDHPNNGPILIERFRRRVVPERAWSIDGDVIPHD